MVSTMDASSWRIGAAKRRFSEVLRRSRTEPQKIYNRDRLVAAVVSPEVLDEADHRQRQRQRPDRSLAEIFAEFRALSADEDWELQVGERVDRREDYRRLMDALAEVSSGRRFSREETNAR